MKQLKSYLNPKSQWHPKGFPEKPKYLDIISFLKDNGFKKIKLHPEEGATSDAFQRAIENNDGPIYFDKKADNWSGDQVYFVKNGNYNPETKTYQNRYSPKDNPVFYVKTTSDGNMPQKINKYDLLYGIYDGKEFDSYDEFVETVNKHFGW